MNEQELFDRLERLTRAFEGMSEGVERSTETTRTNTEATQLSAAQIQDIVAQKKKQKAAEETSRQEEYAYQARIRKNFDDLGITLKTYKEGNETLSKIEKSRVSDIKAQQAAEKELNKILEENTSDYKNLSQASKERYKNELKNEVAMTKALASTGRVFDANGKLVKETDGLTMAQRAHIGILKEQDRVQQQMGGNIARLGQDIAGLAITSTLNLFIAGIKGAWEGANAFTDAILEGAGANTAAAAQVTAEMNALASSIEATGTSMVSLGTETAKTALEMIILGGPIGILVGIIGLLIGASLAYEGYQKQATAATMKRDAELIKKQAAIYDQLYKDFNQVGQASMTTAGGMTQLWKQLGQLGLATKDIAKFIKIIGESGQALATFGSSTVEGLQKFTDIADLVKNKFGETFRRMGIDQDALNEHTLKYMEQQVSLGGLEKKTTEQIAAGAKGYVFELDRAATLLGVTRKEQEKAADAVRAISQFAAAKNVARQEGNTEKLKDLELTENIAKQFMAKGLPQLAEAFIKSKSGAAVDGNQAVMLRYLEPMLEANKRGETNQTRLLQLAGQGIGTYQNQIARNVQVAGEQSGVGIDSFAAFENFKFATAGSAAETEAADAATKPGAPKYDPGETLTKLRTSLDAFTNSQVESQFDAKKLQITLEHDVRGALVAMPNVMAKALDFLPEGLRGPIDKFMQYVIEFGGYIKKFAIENPMMAAGIAAGALVAYKLFAGKMAGIAADKAEDKLVGKLSDALGRTGQTGGATTVAQTAGTVAQTAGTRMERVRKGAGYVMREVPAGPAAGGVPGMPSGGGIPGGGGSSSASEIIKTLAEPGILKNLGKGAGEGLAGFLMAFANPQVVLGAAGLAASAAAIIAGIGAGIAGASWIMGKALPTLMEGIKSFEQLDGKKLEAAGLGIGYLGTGLAVFGVGGVAAGLGSVVSNMSDGLTSFFGGKTPIDKLVEFSKLDINVEKTKNNSEAFVAFSTAMMAAGAMGSISGLGNLVGAISGAATSFFNGKTPIQQMLDFSKLNIDVPKTKNNAEAYVAFSKAFAQSGLASAASGLGNLLGNFADGVSSFFGKKDIITKFVEFANLNIDPKKTKEMAEAFAAFAGGMAASATGRSGGGGGSGSSSSTSSNPYNMKSQGGSGVVQATSLDQLKAAGLRMESKTGDLQEPGAKIDPALIEIAKQVQASTPGFKSFTGFNDRYHAENTPESRHTKGLAFDMVVGLEPGSSKPGKDYDKQIQKAIYAAGGKHGINVKNEYDNPSKQATGGHYHVELPLNPLKAYDGGVFDGPKAGYPVELHGREAIVPMPNPGDKISMDKAQQDGSAKKGALSSVVADTTTSSKDNSSAILMDLYSMMESKFDDLIDKVSTTNNYTNKLLKYSQG